MIRRGVCSSRLLISMGYRQLATVPDPKKSFRSSDLVIKPVSQKQLKPKPEKITFGEEFSDYMLEIDWNDKKGWSKPVLRRTKEISIHPAAKGLHYGIQLFEGLKAFHGVDGKIRLFRPELNMQRMNRSAVRAAMPTFDGEELIGCIYEHLRLEKDWVPKQEGASLYIRPCMFATEPRLGVSAAREVKLMVICSPAASYFSSELAGLRLLADPAYVRAWTGGVGSFKLGSNYGPTIVISEAAARKGCQQVLWLSGQEKLVTESGAMNFGMFWTNEAGEKELITPELTRELVLPGVTRQSIMELTKSWGEFRVVERDFTLQQMCTGIREGRVHELFGCGTAATVIPVQGVLVVDENKKEELYEVPHVDSERSIVRRIYREITDIQYGRKEMKDWVRVVS